MAERKEFIPTDLVEKLASQGKSEPEIIQQLRSQGFTPSQIDKALKVALKEAVEKPQSLLRPDIGTEPEEIPEKFRPTRKPLMEVREKELTHPEKTLIPPELHLAEIPVPEEPPKMETPKVEKPVEHFEAKQPARPVHPSKPIQYPTVPPTGTFRPPEVRHEITLEELAEQIVAEHEKKVEGRMNDFERVDKETQQRLAKMEESVSKFQSTLDSHMKESRIRIDKMEELLDSFSARFEALETAFKQFADFVKKK